MSLLQLEYKNLQKGHRIDHLTICEQLYRNLGKELYFLLQNLDINHENEISNIIEEVYQVGKPILSFDNTCHNVEKASFICEYMRPEKMVDEIKKLLKFY